MNRYFDNWERLVTATLRREELRELARAHSRDPSLSSISSDFSFTSPLHDHFWDPEASSSSSIPFYSKGENLPTPRPEDGILQLHHAMPISFNELKYATRNFHPGNFLGEGRFGPIFEGLINSHTFTALEPGSGMTVAVRKCNGMPGFKEWLKDMNYLPRLHHPNLIKLLAYCDEGDNLLLVYEFVSEGSLFNHLFRGLRRHPSWDTRIKVAIGAARGLSFLHENKVIHKNLSSSNILLDKEFNAKLSNFGYAEEARNSYETPMGEIYVPYQYIGYASPEYKASGYWSEKCDVYAFGVVLLELLFGRQAFHGNRSLVDWAKPYVSTKKGVYAIMDPKLENKYSRKGVLGFVNLAAQCVSTNRPCMPNVLTELERIKDLS